MVRFCRFSSKYGERAVTCPDGVCFAPTNFKPLELCGRGAAFFFPCNGKLVECCQSGRGDHFGNTIITQFGGAEGNKDKLCSSGVVVTTPYFGIHVMVDGSCPEPIDVEKVVDQKRDDIALFGVLVCLVLVAVAGAMIGLSLTMLADAQVVQLGIFYLDMEVVVGDKVCVDT